MALETGTRDAVTAPDPEIERLGPAGVEFEPGTSVGRYVILERIGAGGMGVVYAAFDPDLDRRVALKLLRTSRGGATAASKGARRLLREAQAMARLTHENVVTVHDVGIYEGQVFVAMEFLSGRTLKAWLEEEERGWPAVRDTFLQAGRGLAAAHAGDLVHRDFKPENVVITTEGRAKVLDFGLARAEGGSSGSGTGASEPAAAHSTGNFSNVTLEDLTRTGALMGTPAYMSPEQHLQQPTDARTDQFSFCVSLYESLYGQRPFAGATHAALAFQVTSGEVQAAPRGSTVPRWLREVLLRGLQADPEARWPSMDALLSALDRDPGRAQRRWGLGALTILALGGVGYATVSEGSDETVCAGGSQRASAVWNETRRRELDEAFAATGVPYASSAFTHVALRVDAYAEAWIEQYIDACEATQVRHEQSPQRLDERMGCLGRRLNELQATLDVLDRADVDVVARAVEAVTNLTDPATCELETGSRSAEPTPDEADLAARVEEVRIQLASATALSRAGKYTEALTVSRAANELADALDYCPLTAEARLREGVARDLGGDFALARVALEDAFFLATRCEHPAVATSAAIELIQTVGARLQGFEDGDRWVRHSEALIVRDDHESDPPAARFHTHRANLELSRGDYQAAHEAASSALSIAQQLHDGSHPQVATAIDRVAYVLYHQGKYDEAIDQFERALTMSRELYGEDHPRVADTLHSMGNVLADQGKYDEAIDLITRGLEMRKHTLRPDHANVGQSLNDLGTVYYFQGRHVEALEVQRQALAIRTKALGPRHSSVGGTLLNIANGLHETGDLEGALDHYRRAKKVFEDSVGHEHRFTSAALNNIGILLDELGRFEEAIDHYEQALEIKRVVLGPDHEANAATILNIAVARENLGQLEAALRHYQRATEIWERALPSEHPSIAFGLTGRGGALVSLGRSAEAIPYLERALEIRRKANSPAREIAISEFHLGRSLWHDRSRRARARELVERARTTLRELGEPARVELERLESWWTQRER